MNPQLLHNGFFICIFFGVPFLSKGQSYILKDRVMDLDTKERLRRATVKLQNTAFGDYTNSDRNFQIESILPEKYILAVTASGYNTYEKAICLEEDLDLGNPYLVRPGCEGTGAALQKTIRPTNVSKLLLERPNMMRNKVYGIPPEPNMEEGNFYLDNKWNVAYILLFRYQTVLEGFRIRYNINSNIFELMEPERNLVSVKPGLSIQNIVWMDSAYKVPRYFVKGMDFKDDGVPSSGYFEVIIERELPRMRRTIAVFKESHCNTVLKVGNRNNRIVKRNVFYYLKRQESFRSKLKAKKHRPYLWE